MTTTTSTARSNNASRPWLVALIAAAITVAVEATAGALLVSSQCGQAADTADPDSNVSHTAEHSESGEKYWTQERMKSAQPAPMPTPPREPGNPFQFVCRIFR